MKIKTGIAMLLIAGLMALTAGLVSAQETVTVTGTVTDATTDNPIEGALVVVAKTDPPLSSETDESGGYSIADVPVGTRSITASAADYESVTISAEVLEDDGASVSFSLQPIDEGQEEEEDEGDEGDEDGGKVTGSRKGYVGVFSSSTGGATGSGASDGVFVVVTKKGDIEIQIPEEGLESITRRPGQSAGVPEEGDQVAVLIEFVDQGGDELAQVARQVIVKPAPKKPIVGAVVSVTTDENGVRTLTIMRPDGTTKEVRLGPKDDPPQAGDLVTVFTGPGGGDDGDDPEDGPPVAKGLVRAQEVRRRLEGFLDDLSNPAGDVLAGVAARQAQRLTDLAARLESHAAKHADIIERVSQNENLPPQAVAGMLNGLERAQAGRARAKAKATEARTAAGRPDNPGRPDISGQGSFGNNGSSNGQGGSGNQGGAGSQGDSGNNGGPDNRGNSGGNRQLGRP